MDPLAPIRRDHLVMMAHAKKLEEAVATGPKAALAASRKFLDYWLAIGIEHMDEERDFIYPLVAPECHASANGVEERLRNAADRLQSTMMEPEYFRQSLTMVATALKNHVRHCESNIFAELEVTADPKQMATAAKRLDANRAKWRPTSRGTTPTEPTYL